MIKGVLIRWRVLLLPLMALYLSGCGGEAGLVAHKYQGTWSRLPDFSSLMAVDQRIVTTVGTHNLGTDSYGLVLKGKLNLNQTGQYRFHLRSDDGSRLLLNGSVVANNDGSHTAATVTSGNIPLAQGAHELRIEYFQVSGAQELGLSYQYNDGPITPVSAAMLSHNNNHKLADTGGNDGGGNDGGDDGGGSDGGDSGGGDTPTATNSLSVGRQMDIGDYLASANGSFRFYLQTDSNLVLRDWSTRDSLWSSGTHGQSGSHLILQNDGNLVLYATSGAALWASDTVNSGADRLVLNNDGSLALYAGSAAVWSVNGTGDTGGGNDGGNDGGNNNEGVKVAFIGDTGAGSNFQSVLNLIKREGAELTIVAGDTSYSSSRDDDWDAMVRNTLGNSDPAIIAAGNHDYGDSNFSDVKSYGQSRLNRQSAVNCSGSYGEQMSCRYKNLYIVLSAIGSSGSRSDHESYIQNRLANAPANSWRICAWHKNQRDMQAGGKTDEVGWTAYETCRREGAIIATGHEHSYSRTHLLSDMSDKTIASTSSTFTVTEGRTFAFVSGLGGIGIRDQERSGNWWASIYTSTQGARYGAMFATFYDDRADFYFKNINGQIIDSFTVMKGY